MRKRIISSEQSYDPFQDESSEEKPLKSCTFRNRKRNHWNAEQNKKYVAFLRQNESIFADKVARKKSKHVGNRKSHQAKSHHQKMLKRHKEVKKIIEYFQLRFQRKEVKKSARVSTTKMEDEMSIKLEKQVSTQRYEQSMEELLERISLFKEWEDFQQNNLCDWLQEI